MPERQPIIILVEPQLGENIGMAARAMLNCGLTRLRIVNPRDGWPSMPAARAASGAASVIEQADVFETVEQAVADCHHVYATTARNRDATMKIVHPESAAQKIAQSSQDKGEQSAILFGPERTGLTSQHMVHADTLLTIPLNPDYSSLNLAQAVLLICYQIWQQFEQEPQIKEGLHTGDSTVASKKEIAVVTEHLITELNRSGFFPTEEMREGLEQNVAHTMQRMSLTSQEARTWHGMIKALTGNSDWRE